MKEDPIVEEVRQAGQDYVDSFNGDWKALIADLRRRSEAQGRQPLALPPKPPRPRPAKKAG
jgi:hypothetical protein